MERPAETIEVHDKYQFEVKFSYPFAKGGWRVADYHVETYFFLPSSLGVNKRSYSREKFFDDTRKYIRFKTPAMLLRSISGAPSSPMALLEESIEELSLGAGASASSFEERLKMLCSIFKSASRDEETFIESSAGDPNFAALVAAYLDSVGQTLSKFRGLKIKLQAPTVDPRCLTLFKMADEFMSVTACKRFAALALFLKTRGCDEPLRVRAVEAAKAETAYRASCLYPSIPSESSDNEEFLHRESALKKIMASVLFLKTSAKREGRVMEQLLFGFAAGVAMAFATFVAFYTRTVVAIQDFSVSFFVILVVAYMFKDRIKELSRGYFSSKLRERLYDYRIDILTALDERIGVCKESFCFVPESSLPPAVRALREKDDLCELERSATGEEIMLSRKSVSLRAEKRSAIVSGFGADGVVDITRFNVRGFLDKMDNPNKELFIPSSESCEIVSCKAKRVYCVHLVIRYGMAGCDDVCQSFRLMLSRNGIRRIERVC